MNKTRIEWADATWNPVTGCLNKCEYCYARKFAFRFGGHWDAEKQRNVRDDSSMCVLNERMTKHTEGKRAKPGIHEPAPFPYDFNPTFHRYKLDEPTRARKPLTIFVCSMADLFGAWVPDEWIFEVYRACMRATQHRYLFLTKNPWRYSLLAGRGLLQKGDMFWYGASAENHINAAAAFRHVPEGWQGYNLFLSAEPLYGPINLRALNEWPRWIIIGAETGNRKGKRLPERAWIDDLCAGADKIGAKVFMKDSLLPIVGAENMRRELPFQGGGHGPT